MHKDRKLVKQPKPIRVDQYLHDYISASANMAGVSWSEMARMMLQESAKNRIKKMSSSNSKGLERI